MLSDARQVVFKLDIEGFSHDLQVLEFHVREALNQPYKVKLELVSERPDLDLESLLHRPAFLRFDPDDAGIHGQVNRPRRFRQTPDPLSDDPGAPARLPHPLPQPAYFSTPEHPEINRLLHNPSLQPIGERIVLAADLARQWANERGRP